MIPLNCPHCGEAVVVRRGDADRTIYCDNCNAVVSEPDFEDRPRPRRPRAAAKKRGALFVITLVFGILFLACGGMGTLIYFLFIHEIDETVTAKDKEDLITAEHVAQFVQKTKVDPSKGKYTKVRHLDGSRELTYEYEDIADPANGVYILCTLGVERSAKDARDAYAGLKLGNRIGMGSSPDVVEVERPDLWSWGDASRCVLLQNKGNSVGNSFMARKGKRYFLIYVVGIYFERREDIQDLLKEFLQKADSYEG